MQVSSIALALAPLAGLASATALPSAAAAEVQPRGSSSKRGLAYNDASLCDDFKGSAYASWGYNWDSASGGLDSSFEYVPMLWGLSSDHTSSWTNNAAAAISAGSKHLLGFNEPDLDTQSNLDPQTAADGWLTYMEPFAGQAQLGAPAVTNGGAPMGLTWLEEFLTACASCTIDFVPIHWYDSSPDNYAYFQSYIEQAYAAGGGRPLWITEFGALTGSQDQQSAFLETVMPWLDSLDYVHRYAYFMVADGYMLTGDSLNEIGDTFDSYYSSSVSSVFS